MLWSFLLPAYGEPYKKVRTKQKSGSTLWYVWGKFLWDNWSHYDRSTWVLSCFAATAAKSLQSCPTVRPQRWQPTRLPHPWDSPGKNTGVGCHCLLQLSCFSCVQLFVALWTLACQVPLSMGFFRQDYWGGLPWLLPGDLPNPGIKLTPLTSPALAVRFFTTSATWEALIIDLDHIFFLSSCIFAVAYVTKSARRIWDPYPHIENDN